MSNWKARLAPALTPLFRAWWSLNRGMTLGVRGVATDAEGRVLLIRHTYRPGWYLPGGGVERAQTVHDAVVREMAEEGGIEAMEPPVLLGFYSNHKVHPNDHVALFRFGAWTPCPPLENGEIAERGFFAIQNVPADTSAGTRRRLAEIFEGKPQTADW